MPDVEEIEEEHESEVINETLFTFEAFEAVSDLPRVCLFMTPQAK